MSLSRIGSPVLSRLRTDGLNANGESPETPSTRSAASPSPNGTGAQFSQYQNDIGSLRDTLRNQTSASAGPKRTRYRSLMEQMLDDLAKEWKARSPDELRVENTTRVNRGLDPDAPAMKSVPRSSERKPK